MVQIERTSQHADDVRVIAKDAGNGLTDVVGLSRDAEDSVGLIVDEGQAGVAGNGEHTVPHAGHDVAIERVSRPRRARRPPPVRTHVVRAGGSPSGRTWTRLGHYGGLHKTDLNPLSKGQRLCPMQNPEIGQQVADSRGVRVKKLNRSITKS